MSLRQTFLDRKLWKEKALSAQTSGAQFIHASFLRPVHADKVGILYSRNLEDLKKINNVMSQQIRGVLSQGLIDGKHPRELAKAIVDRMDKVGIRRARVLARTEMVNAHAEATLNSFQEAGVTSVRTEAEFSTAGDDRVCELCEPLSRKVFSLEDARGVIPVHPNCRCAWLPVQTVIPPVQVPHKPSEITKPIPKVVKPGGKPVLPKVPRRKPKPHHAQPKPLTPQERAARKESLALRKAELEKFAELEKASLEGKRPWGVSLKENRKGNTWTLNQRGGEFDHSKSVDYQARETLRDGTNRFFTREYRDVTEEYRKYGDAVSPGVKKIVKDLDADAKPLKQDYYAYRGVHLPEDRNPKFIKQLENFKPGDPYDQFGPTSFSSDPVLSVDSYARNHTLVQVKLKKGLKVLSDNLRESEMVIPPGYRLRIVEVHKNQIFEQKRMIEIDGVWKETTDQVRLKQILIAELEKVTEKPVKIATNVKPTKSSNASYQATRKIAKELDMAAARSEYTSAYGATPKQVWFASKLMNELGMKPKEFGYGYVNTNAVLTKKRASILIEDLLELKKKAPPPKPATAAKPAPKPKVKLTKQQLELANFRGNKNVLHRRAWAKENEKAKVYEASPSMIKSGDYEGGWGASIKIKEGEKILRGDKVRVTTKAGKSWEATVWEVLFEGDDYVIVSTTETLVK